MWHTTHIHTFTKLALACIWAYGMSAFVPLSLYRARIFNMSGSTATSTTLAHKPRLSFHRFVFSLSLAVALSIRKRSTESHILRDKDWDKSERKKIKTRNEQDKIRFLKSAWHTRMAQTHTHVQCTHINVQFYSASSPPWRKKRKRKIKNSSEMKTESININLSNKLRNFISYTFCVDMK